MITIQGETIRDVITQLGLGTPWLLKVEKHPTGFKFRAMNSDHPQLDKNMVLSSWQEVAAAVTALVVEIQSAEAAKQG